MTGLPATTRQLRSLVEEPGQVRVSIDTIDTPKPSPHQVLVRVDAAPLNPSDLALMLAMSDVEKAEARGTPDEPVVTAPIPPALMPSLAARVGLSMPVGNEGAGVVVAAGESAEAQALRGRTVGFPGDGTYGEHVLAAAQMCLPLPQATDATAGASCFVNR